MLYVCHDFLTGQRFESSISGASLPLWEVAVGKEKRQ